jgi:hypothetical protein
MRNLDSTLPSPGAADDALSVGVMLECIRVLTHTPDWTPAYSIVFRRCPIDVSWRFFGLSFYSFQSCRGITPRRVPSLFPHSILLPTRELVPSCLRFPYIPVFSVRAFINLEGKNSTKSK